MDGAKGGTWRAERWKRLLRVEIAIEATDIVEQVNATVLRGVTMKGGM